MLQRIYGTAWENEEQLKAYLHFKEEAKRRDHRRLGQDLDLFSIQVTLLRSDLHLLLQLLRARLVAGELIFTWVKKKIVKSIIIYLR